jgi:hypothetical protein
MVPFEACEKRALFCMILATGSLRAFAQPPPVLTWITNSSVKLEQIIGDLDWGDLAGGVTNLTASQTGTRFHILGTDNGGSFEDNGKLIILFGDTIPDDRDVWSYHAADPFCWSTNADGESPLLLNFYTNRPFAFSHNWPAFVQPRGIDMSGNAVPKCGIALSNGVFVICNTGSDSNNTNNPHASDYSVLLTFNEANLLTATNTYLATNSIFFTNRVMSMLNTNLSPTNPAQGHFIFTSLHVLDTNVLIFGTGEFRASDIYLAKVSSANFVSGQGTLYFTGLTNGESTWSPFESNSVPVVQDNPTNGPAWPNDTPSAGDLSVIYPPGLGVWLMTFDGGRGTKQGTEGVYFAYAAEPWGPWSTPQLVFNKNRDGGNGVFIYDAKHNRGPAGPVINPSQNNPTNTDGAVYGPYLLERFARVTNSTLYLYYTMSTWNPYTVVKMRSAFEIVPTIDPASLVHKKGRFSFSWAGTLGQSYEVDYSTNLPGGWTAFTNVITSTNSTFSFEDNPPGAGGLGPIKYYRVRALQ